VLAALAVTLLHLACTFYFDPPAALFRDAGGQRHLDARRFDARSGVVAY
jgi:hypothetical protein